MFIGVFNFERQPSFNLLLYLFTVLCCVLSTVWLVRYRWRRQQEESRQMYVMVAQIVGKYFYNIFYNTLNVLIL